MANDLDRRDFLAGLGVALGGAALGDLAVVGAAAAQDTPKGRIPETPVKFGHITIQSGPGAILGLPSLKGHTLAAEEINAAGGLLGKRKIETITADEAAGPEATVKEVKRIAVINPDYALGGWFQLHFDAAREKLLPGSEIVSEVWAPFPNTADFTSHITKTVAAKPDIVVTSMWGGMYVSFYKQALGHGLFRRARLAGNINFGVVRSEERRVGKEC